MRYNIIVHQANGEPIEGEMEELPMPQATFLTLKNPHKRSNRELDWLDHRTNTILVPFTNIMCVEVVVARGEQELITKHGVELR